MAYLTSRDTYQEHLKLLGLKVRSRVTGWEGVVTSISFDLNGCVQAAVNPGVDKEGKNRDGIWIDTKSLDILAKKPIQTQPDFAIIDGGRELPAFTSHPPKI